MRDLKRIFNPKSIAIIGARDKENSVGWGLMKNALKGKSRVYAVNPNRKKVLGVKCFPSIKSIPEVIDLAIIAVPAHIVPLVVEECSEKKVGAMIVISAGFSEDGPHGKILQERIVKIAKKANIPLLGPNCLGVLRPKNRLNASFAPNLPKPGKIAFISQSGALLDSVVDYNENYGFSGLVSYGNGADLSLTDFIEWFGYDEETKIIALYLEGILKGRKFMEVCKRISKNKSILAIKAGKSEQVQKAVSTHTGSLAGDYQIYQTAFKQSGVQETETLEELFDVAKALAWQPRIKNGIAIITNGGGCGVLGADYCQKLGVKLNKITEENLRKLDKVMHPAFSRNNPLDIVGDALSCRYKDGIKILLSQKDINGILVIQTSQIMTESEKNAKIIVEASKKYPKKAIIACFMGGKIANLGIDILEKNNIPNYSDIKRATRALKGLIK